MNFNFLDIVFILIFLVFIGISAKKGFTRVILNIIAIVIAIVLSAVLSAPLSKIIYSSFVETKVVENLEKTVPSDITDTTEKLSYITSSIPDFAKKYTEKNEVLKKSINELNRDVFKSRGEFIEKLNKDIIRPFCENVLKMSTYILLIIILSFIFRLIAEFFGKSIHKTLNKTDYIFGGILGLIEGILAIYIISIGLLYISKKTGGQINEFVSQSVLVNKLSQISFINLF